MSLQRAIITLSLIGFISCATGTYNYKQQGTDWTGTCSTGKLQSPIDIITSSAKYNSQQRLYIDWSHITQHAKLENKGLTIQQDGTWLTLNVMDKNNQLRTYTGAQFHFHTRSEHSLDGQFYDAELHIVCPETTDSRAANTGSAFNNVALGFLFKVTKDNSQFFNSIDYSKVGQTVTNNGEITFGYMVQNKVHELEKKGKKLQFYQYDGSLTTPGCDEVVTHIVLGETFAISQSQLDNYKKVYANDANWGKGNYREIQKLEGRTILKGDVINDSILPHFEQRKEQKYIAALFIVLFILIIILFVLVAIAMMKAIQAGSSKDGKAYAQVKTDQNVN